MRTRKRGAGLYRYFFGKKSNDVPEIPEKPVQQYTIAQAKDLVQTRIQTILTETNYSHLQKYMQDLMCIADGKCISEIYTTDDARYVITFEDLQLLQSAEHWPVIREKYLDLVLILYADLLNAPIKRIRLDPDRRIYKVIPEPPKIKSYTPEIGTSLDPWVTDPQRAGTRRRRKK
jgi:hypothetical protein